MHSLLNGSFAILDVYNNKYLVPSKYLHGVYKHYNRQRINTYCICLFDIYYLTFPPTNPYWARVVGYGPFSLWVIHKEGCAPAVGTLIG
jgi:hypothetical protein